MATVYNLDWPESPNDTPAQQRAQMRAQFDNLKALGFNAVLFHARTEGDALYRSPTEPWSRVLTGTQGKDPGWDPLEYAVLEAHRRGMELHAWLNPYRAYNSVQRDANGNVVGLDQGHVMIEHPEWVMNIPTLPNKRILDPGIPAVRNYVIDVVGDIVSRYDVDGVHFDDYFYPYPEGSFGGMTNQDLQTFNTYGAPLGFTDIATFRKYSVNMMVRGVQAKINSIRPSVRYGISPFGIWKSGTPTGVSGMSGADAIFADALDWMGQAWLDYLTPQLYWNFGGNQDYAKLAPWWFSKMTPTNTSVPMPTTPRHFYPGLIVSNSTGTLPFPRYVTFNRTNGYGGQVLFRSSLVYASTVDTVYRRRAVPLSMPWKNDNQAPNAPAMAPPVNGTTITLSWAKPLPAADGDTARWYGVYRFPQGVTPDVSSNRYLINVVGAGTATVSDTPPTSEGTTFTYVVTAFDENWNESAPSLPVVGTDAEGELAPGSAASVDVVGANPVARGSAARLRVVLAQAGRVSVGVYDVLGRRVAGLSDGMLAAGSHELTWATPPSAGLYVVRMTGDAEATTVLRVR